MPSFLKKFFAKFESFFGHAPEWIHVAQTVVTFAIPVATAVISGFDPALLPVAAPIMAEVKADLATISVLVAEGSATPSLTSAISRVQANLTDLMQAGHIKDAGTQAKVTLLVSEFGALASLLPAIAA